MSYDLAVWSPVRSLSPREAEALYTSICEGMPELSQKFLKEDPAIQAFYAELTSSHPEIDDVADDRVDDESYCPWSCAFDKSSCHLILSCVWSQAENVFNLVNTLAQKHELTIFDPQAEATPELPTSRFGKLSGGWNNLNGGQRLILGFLVVAAFFGIIFAGAYLWLVPSP